MITLIVIALLTVIVVAFSSSTSTDRLASRALMNRARAEAAAEAGLAEAVAQFSGLKDLRFITMQPAQLGSAPTLQPLLPTGELNSSAPSVSLASAAPAGSTPERASIKVNDQIILTADWKSLLDGPATVTTSKEIARYAFFADESGSKQNIRYASTAGASRKVLAQLGEFPLVGAPLPATDNPVPVSQRLPLTDADRKLFLTPASANQFTGFPQAPLPADGYSFTTASPAVDLRPDGKPKLDLKKLKTYLDGMTEAQKANQKPGNPRAAVVEELLTDGDGAAWGGGNLSFLSKPGTRYTPVQQRQIVANLIDYIDDDLIPTTDNVDNPTYFGVEGRMNAAGQFEGHPIVTFIGTGTSVLRQTGGAIFALWTLVSIGVANPTDVPLEWQLYSVDPVEVEYEGTANPGARDLNSLFPTLCGDNLTYTGSEPQTISPRSGVMRPAQYSAKHDFRGQRSISLPATTSFSGIKQKIKKLVIRRKAAGSTPAYVVQVFNNLSSISIPHSPLDIPPTTSGNDLTYRLSETQGDSKSDLHLNDDPRLNFQASAWKLNTSLVPSSGTPRATGTPPAAPTPFSRLDFTTSDFRAVPTTPHPSEWYRSGAYLEDFAAASLPKAPATLPNIAAGTAVRSIGELGYIHTGRPWETLRLYISSPSVADKERDIELLEQVRSGSLETTAYTTIPNASGTPIPTRDGGINLNARKLSALAALLLGASAAADSDASARADGTADPDFSKLWQALAGMNTPMVSLKDFLTIQGVASVTSQGTTDFAREAVARRIANAATFHSTRFTVYAVGEARQARGTGTSATVESSAFALLEAEIELQLDSNGKPVAKVVRRMFR